MANNDDLLPIERLALEGKTFDRSTNDKQPTMTRAEAAALGLTTYYDGTVCARGHVGASRFTQNGACCACHAMSAAERVADGDMRGIRRELSTRRQALIAGELTYFTGKPCKNGHIAPRYVSTGGCLECLRERQGVSEAPKPFDLYEPLTKRRYRIARPDDVDRPLLEARWRSGSLLQLRIDGGGNVFERIVRRDVPDAWRPVSYHPAVIDELRRLLDSS